MRMFRRAKAGVVVLVTLMTLGSGLINLYSVVGRGLPERRHWLREVFPLEFIRLSHFATLLIGFALVVTALNIYKRKQRAHRLVLLLSCASIVFHLTKGLDYEEALLSVVLIALLLISRELFTLKSGPPDWRSVLPKLSIAMVVTILYGVGGLWLLEPREFGMNFTIGKAVVHTFRILAFVPDPQVVPQTHHAVWFFYSLRFVTLIFVGYSLFALFR